MTPEELDSIGDAFTNNHASIPLEVNNENATLVAAIATIVEILRKDLKSIVQDAVNDAMANGKPEQKPDTSNGGKHPLDMVDFKYRSTKSFLESSGVNYLEDIKGYISGNLAETILPIISIGEFPNGILKPIPVDNFEDIGIAMQSNNIPFKRI